MCWRYDFTIHWSLRCRMIEAVCLQCPEYQWRKCVDNCIHVLHLVDDHIDRLIALEHHKGAALLRTARLMASQRRQGLSLILVVSNVVDTKSQVSTRDRHDLEFNSSIDSEPDRKSFPYSQSPHSHRLCHRQWWQIERPDDQSNPHYSTMKRFRSVVMAQQYASARHFSTTVASNGRKMPRVGFRLDDITRTGVNERIAQERLNATRTVRDTAKILHNSWLIVASWSIEVADKFVYTTDGCKTSVWRNEEVDSHYKRDAERCGQNRGRVYYHHKRGVCSTWTKTRVLRSAGWLEASRWYWCLYRYGRMEEECSSTTDGIICNSTAFDETWHMNFWARIASSLKMLTVKAVPGDEGWEYVAVTCLPNSWMKTVKICWWQWSHSSSIGRPRPDSYTIQNWLSHSYRNAKLVDWTHQFVGKKTSSNNGRVEYNSCTSRHSYMYNMSSSNNGALALLNSGIA